MGGRVLIIGGGASGMTAGIFAARAGASVTILEHKDRVGRKLLATGNGRCNFTNRAQGPDFYRCSRADFPWQVIRRFPPEETLEFFGKLGILPRERDGRLYPNSDQASSVLDVLRDGLERAGARTVTGCRVRGLSAGEGGRGSRVFTAETDRGRFTGDALILAAGSMAAAHTGSDGSGYALAEGFGHRILAPLPALVPLRCGEPDYRQLAGVRAEGRVTLFVGDGDGAGKERGNLRGRPEVAGEKGNLRGWSEVAGEKGNLRGWSAAAEDRGEIQLTAAGISGIPVFQVSRYASAALRDGRPVKAVIDFLPRMTEKEARALLAARRANASGWSGERFMTGLLNRRLALCLLNRAGIGARETVEEVPERGWRALLAQIKSFETRVVGTGSFEEAQVCLGGVDTAQVDPATLGSKLVPGLYFAGEILDVDGACGGYNLQWAWSSGAVAGRSAARSARQAKAARRTGGPEDPSGGEAVL